MPYIKQENRGGFVKVERLPKDAGELNYLITSLCLATLRDWGHEACAEAGAAPQDVVSYASINAVVGALECAKLEMYRRQAAPYEDLKIRENGDMPWLRTELQ
jgi:uncharacterized protein DUF6899